MQRPHDTPPAAAGDGTIAFGPLAVDLAGYVVSVSGRDVPVTLTEFLLLRALMARPYRVLDRAALLDARSGHSHGSKGRVGPHPERTVDLHVSRLRRKLAQAGYDCIHTMRYVGYRFVPTE